MKEMCLSKDTGDFRGAIILRQAQDEEGRVLRSGTILMARLSKHEDYRCQELEGRKQ